MDYHYRIILILLLFFSYKGISQENAEVEISHAFDVNVNRPIDKRIVIPSLADTTSIKYIYDGLLTYIKDADEYYKYNGTQWVKLIMIESDSINLFQNYIQYDPINDIYTLDKKTKINRSTSGNVATFSAITPDSADQYSGITLNIAGGTDWNGSEIRNITGTPTPLQSPQPLNPRLGFFTQNPDTYLPVDRTEKVSIMGNGNVGIGTITPSAKLHVKEVNNSTTASQLLLQNEGGGFHTAAIAFQVSSTGETTGFAPKAAIAYERGLANGRGKMHFYNDSANDANAYADGDEKMTIDNSGNVGIGTTSPSAKLDIDENNINNSVLKVGGFSLQPYSNDNIILANNDTYYSTDSIGFVRSGANGSSWIHLVNQYIHFRSTPSGNPDSTYVHADMMSVQPEGVGIGTTSPSAKLHVDDYYQSGSDRQFQIKHFNIQDLNTRNTLINTNAYYEGIAGEMTPIDTGGFVSMQMYHSGIRFRGGTGNGGVSKSDTTFMHIDNSDANRGNIGIGTTSPSAKFHITGGTSSDQFRIGHGAIVEYRIGRNTTTGFLDFQGDQTGFAGYSFKNSAGNSVAEINAQSVHLNMKALDANEGGQIAFDGGTSYPEATYLDRYTDEFRIFTSNATDSDVNLFNTGAGNMNLFVDGNVGIGTTTPTNRLTINEDINEPATVGIFSTTENVDIKLGQGVSNNLTTRWIYSATSSDAYAWIVSDSYANDIRIDADDLILQSQSGGNLGIGTIAPSEKLDVVGNGRFRSIGSGTSSGALHYEADGTLTTNTSDRRLKKNIVEVNDSIALQKLLELKPSEFNWKKSKKVMRDSSFINERKQNIIELTMQIDSLQGANTGSGTSIPNQIKELTQQRKTAKEELKQYRKINKKRKENADRTNIGFIAQDVAEVLPSAVGKNDDGYLFLRDEQIGAITVSAIKEQQRQIEEQKQLIQQLLQRIEALENE